MIRAITPVAALLFGTAILLTGQGLAGHADTGARDTGKLFNDLHWSDGGHLFPGVYVRVLERV